MTTIEYAYPDAGARYDDAYVVDPVFRAAETLGVRRILDVGCGNGALAARLAAKGYDVTGIDPSDSGIAVATQSVPGARFFRQSVEDDLGALDPAGYDLVVAVEVVEHLPLPRLLPRLARRALRPGGHLLLTTPYHGYLKNLVISLTNGWDAHLDPLWDGGHIKFWSERTLRAMLSSEQFDVRRVTGAGRLPFLWKSVVVVSELR